MTITRIRSTMRIRRPPLRRGWVRAATADMLPGKDSSPTVQRRRLGALRCDVSQRWPSTTTIPSPVGSLQGEPRAMVEPAGIEGVEEPATVLSAEVVRLVTLIPRTATLVITPPRFGDAE